MPRLVTTLVRSDISDEGRAVATPSVQQRFQMAAIAGCQKWA